MRKKSFKMWASAQNHNKRSPQGARNRKPNAKKQVASKKKQSSNADLTFAKKSAKKNTRDIKKPITSTLSSFGLPAFFIFKRQTRDESTAFG